jgi:hypothetical protein
MNDLFYWDCRVTGVIPSAAADWNDKLGGVTDLNILWFLLRRNARSAKSPTLWVCLAVFDRIVNEGRRPSIASTKSETLRNLCDSFRRGGSE